MESNFENFIDAVKRGDMKTVGELCRNEWIEKECVGLWPVPKQAATKGGCRPIHWACVYGHATIVQLLSERGCSIEAETRDGWRPIHCACRSGHVAVVQLLLSKRCKKNVVLKGGWRPIHCACVDGHADVVQLLLNRGCQIEVPAKDGWRPLHLACVGGHTDVVEMLLNKNCQMEPVTKSKLPPPDMICSKGHVSLDRFQLRSNIPIEGGWRSIHWACDKGHTAVVQLLLRKGCEIEAATKNGWRPIHWACNKGHTDIVQLLLEKGCEIDVATKDGRHPIHLASDKGHADIVQLLMGRGCNVDVQTKDGQTPLDLTKKMFSLGQPGRSECTKLIEEAQKTASVFDAARKDDIITFQRLNFPLWTKEPKTGQTLLDVVMQSNAKSIFDQIKQTPVTEKTITDFLSLDRKNYSDQSYGLLHQWLVHCCIRHNIDWAFIRLCCADVVNSRPLKDGTTCLDTAVEYRRSLCVRHILQKYVAPDDTWDRAKNSATQKGHEEVVELINHRQTTLQRNKLMGRNRLHLAVTEGDLDMVEYVLRKGLADHSGTDQDGDTPLMVAVANRMDECANAIKHHGADVNVVNNHGQTVFHAAVAGRMHELPPWLVDGTCQVKRRDCMGLTPLQQAVVGNLEHVAAQLVAIGEDHRSIVQVRSNSRRLSNGNAKTNPSSEHFELTRKENSSSLCLKLNGRIYPCFMKDFTKDDVNFLDENDNSLLHLTALLMDADGCRRLLKKGAVVGAINKHHNTPLLELLIHLHRHRHRFKDIDDKTMMTFRTLIDGGASIKDKDNNSKTALQIAIELLDERLLLEFVRCVPLINGISPDEFDKCLENGMFRFLEKIIPKLSQRMVQERITAEVVRKCAIRGQHSTVKIFFTHAKSDVQEEVLGNLLFVTVCRNDVECFSDFLNLQRGNWKLMSNGESILTALIRKKQTTFCELLLQSESASKLLELTDANGNSPLMVAIRSDIKKLIDHLILETIAVNCENTEGDTALSMLLEKVSSATGDRLDQLKLWIKQLIKSSADPYRVNKHNRMAINCCTTTELKKEFEAFYRKLPKPGSKQTAEEINMCGVCLDRKVDRFLDDCGHTLCNECADALFHCPFCRAPIKNRRRMVLP